MNRSRSRRVVLLLDCCYAGAFERGMTARAGAGVEIETQFGGRGRAVITASNAMEYAFEGDELTDTQELQPSVFTSALVEGLQTGEADRDQDGMVALDELYDYVYDKVREATPNQTPCKWTFGVEGDLYIARRNHPVSTPAPLPPELQQAIDSPLAGVRAGAVGELTRLLRSRHAGLALAARLSLAHLIEDDSRTVSAAATAALGTQAPPAVSPPAPPKLALSATVIDFGPLNEHSRSPERRVAIANAGGGTLNARGSASASWLQLRHVGDELVIAVDTAAVGQHEGVVNVDSDGGSATIRVTATVDPHPTPTPQPSTLADGQPPATEQTTTDQVGESPSSPPPTPQHAPAGRSRRRRDGSIALGAEAGGDERDNLATLRQRAGAALIDLLVLIPGYILIVAGSIDNDVRVWIGLAVVAAIKIYSRWYLQGKTGQSWGKRIRHLRLVDMVDKQPIGFRVAFERGLAHTLDIFSLGVGYLLPAWDLQRQTLADKVKHTIVISDGKAGSTVSHSS